MRKGQLSLSHSKRAKPSRVRSKDEVQRGESAEVSDSVLVLGIEERTRTTGPVPGHSRDAAIAAPSERPEVRNGPLLESLDAAPRSNSVLNPQVNPKVQYTRVQIGEFPVGPHRGLREVRTHNYVVEATEAALIDPKLTPIKVSSEGRQAAMGTGITPKTDDDSENQEHQVRPTNTN